MKSLTRLLIAFLTCHALALIAVAGPESLPRNDYKESKTMVAPAPEPPPCNWTGFYIGVHGGYGGGDLTWKDVDFGDNDILFGRVQNGFFGGGQIGYDFQIGSFVIGATGDFDYSTIDAQGGGEKPFKTWSDWMGSTGLRAGFAWKHLLFYGTGGVAFVDENYSYEANDGFKADEVRIGGFAGAGIEYMIGCHWSAKVEYRHLFLGTDSIHDTTTDGLEIDHESYDVELDQDSVQLGFGFKF